MLVLVSSVPLFMIANKNFLPQDDQGEFEINLRAPEGTSLENTEIITNRDRQRRARRGPRSRLHAGHHRRRPVARPATWRRSTCRLTPLEQRKRDQFVIMNIVRSEILPPLSAGLRTSVQPVATIGGGGSQNADVQFLINGPDLKTLESIGNQLVEKAKAMPGVVDVDTSLNVGKPELSIQLDRPKASDLGVQIGDAAEALRLLVGGDQVTTYNEGSEQYEVHLRALAAEPLDRAGHRRADRAVVEAGQRRAEQHRDRSRPGTAPSDINRLARQRQVTVIANLLPDGVAVGRAERHRRRSSPASGRAPSTAAPSPAARKSSAARRRTSCSRSCCRWSSCI